MQRAGVAFQQRESRRDASLQSETIQQILAKRVQRHRPGRVGREQQFGVQAARFQAQLRAGCQPQFQQVRIKRRRVRTRQHA